MDCEMPRLNGPDAAREIRRSGLTIPIIGITGNVLTEDRNKFLEAGANEVVAKPLDTQKLVLLMKKVWSESRGNSRDDFF